MRVISAVQLALTVLYAVEDGRREVAVLCDPNGRAWCSACATEACDHTAAVLTAGAEVPVRRRKLSGGRRAGAGRPRKPPENQNAG